MGAGQYHEGHLKMPVERVMVRSKSRCSCSTLDAHGGPWHGPHSADVTAIPREPGPHPGSRSSHAGSPEAGPALPGPCGWVWWRRSACPGLCAA